MVVISGSGVGGIAILSSQMEISLADTTLERNEEIAILSKLTGSEQTAWRCATMHIRLRDQKVHPMVLLMLSPFRFALNGGLLSKLSKNEKSV